MLPGCRLRVEMRTLGHLVLAAALGLNVWTALGQVGKVTATEVGAKNIYAGSNSWSLATLPGEILYVDVNLKVTNVSGASPASHLDVVKVWGDLSPNRTNSLMNLGTVPNPIYSTTGGPTNGPCIRFTNTASYTVTGYLTNAISGVSIPQPNTFFLVMMDPTCCNADFGGAIFDSMTAGSGANQMVSFHPNTGLTAINLVAPTSVSLFDGTANNGSANFGWPFGSWAVVTVQLNGSSTHVWVNGSGPLHTLNLGPDYNPGTAACLGFILGNSMGSGIIGHTTPYTSPSIVDFAAVIWVTGSYWQTSANRLRVEEALGSEFGITVP
jgi:hypothetical protein